MPPELVPPRTRRSPGFLARLRGAPRRGARGIPAAVPLLYAPACVRGALRGPHPAARRRLRPTAARLATRSPPAGERADGGGPAALASAESGAAPLTRLRPEDSGCARRLEGLLSRTRPLAAAQRRLAAKLALAARSLRCAAPCSPLAPSAASLVCDRSPSLRSGSLPCPPAGVRLRGPANSLRSSRSTARRGRRGVTRSPPACGGTAARLAARCARRGRLLAAAGDAKLASRSALRSRSPSLRSGSRISGRLEPHGLGRGQSVRWFGTSRVVVESRLAEPCSLHGPQPEDACARKPWRRDFVPL
jgi:hypothetical protein